MHTHQSITGIFFVKFLIRIIIILTITIVLCDVKFARKSVWERSENKLEAITIYQLHVLVISLYYYFCVFLFFHYY